MLRVSEANGVTHGGAWTYGEWVGRAVCGFEFVAAKNQWQRKTPEGLLRLQDGPLGGYRRGLVLLEANVPVDCMTCLVRAAFSP